jgi:hypothetical protein
MCPPNRRTILRGVGTALLGGIAGCAGSPLGNSPQLGHLDVTNYDDREHTVHVLLLESAEPTYWASTRVPPADDDGLGTATFEGYPADARPDRLLARLDGESLSAAERFEFGEYDADCLGLQIEVGGDRTPPDLSIWYTAGSDPCERTGTAE